MLGRIEVTETVLRKGAQTFRPLCAHLKLKAQSYSKQLQRLMVDFGAECSFEKASNRLYQHHRLTVSASHLRKVTLRHAGAMKQEQAASKPTRALPAQGADTIITAMDGCMIPIVECTQGKDLDRRKNRNCHWEEMRLCAARIAQAVRTYYGVCLGSVEEAGELWNATVQKASWALLTYLHVIGDGAPWIAEQAKQCLGTENYLIDFYHLCEYLAAAGKTAATHARWLDVQKQRLKTNHPERVIQALKPYVEDASKEDSEAPVRAALRYLENRLEQIDYAGALENDLPIGSGMIEGAHRHVLQARLKISGAWWTRENAASMASLRVCRANEEEELYWKKAA